MERREFLKSAGLVSTGMAFSPKDVPSEGERVIDQIKTHKNGMAVWWTGQDGWLIKYENFLISTDLALESSSRIEKSPVLAQELAGELDIAFITHKHGDHFERETCRILVENGNCKFVIPYSCLEVAREKVRIPEDRIILAEPRKPFDVQSIYVEPIRAIHGNSKYAVYYEANFQDCGYVITLGGKRILQIGDSVLLEDQLFLKDIDVLFFSPTEHNTYIDQSVILINELEPDYIFPQHGQTFVVTPENRFWTTAYPYEVKLRLSKELQKRYHILKIGEKKLIV